MVSTCPSAGSSPSASGSTVRAFSVFFSEMPVVPVDVVWQQRVVGGAAEAASEVRAAAYSGMRAAVCL